MIALMILAGLWLALHACAALEVALLVARDCAFDDDISVGVFFAAALMTPVSVLALRVLWEGPLCLA